ncbi:MAG: aldehyde dehydrogenase family protein, partial [Proteobacteria bacterium]
MDANERIEIIDPASDLPLGSVPDMAAAGAMLAVDAAAAAFPQWRSTTAGERGKLLRRWADLMIKHRSDLAMIMVREQGKPRREAEGEVDYAASFLFWFAEEASRAYGDTIPGHAPGKRLTVLREPVGVVAAITPWNFPLAMITRKAGPALAAGCTIVIKPSELTPFCALALAVLAEEAGLPPGVVNIVTGAPAPIGDILTGDTRVRKFTFTGSTPVGSALAARCMATVKRISLELGGNAPVVVFDDADIEQALDGVMAAKFRNSGQTCVCANRIYVQDGCYDAFVSALEQRIAALQTGSGLDNSSDVGPLINASAVAKVERHVA